MIQRNAAVGGVSLTNHSFPRLNRRIRFRQGTQLIKGIQRQARPSRKAQDIAESPRITSTGCAGLSRGSRDCVNLGRFVSKNRTRMLNNPEKTRNFKSASASGLKRNAGQGRVAGVSISRGLIAAVVFGRIR